MCTISPDIPIEDKNLLLPSHKMISASASFITLGKAVYPFQRFYQKSVPTISAGLLATVLHPAWQAVRQVPCDPDDNIIGISNALGNAFDENDNPQLALVFFELCRNFTGDDELNNKIKELDEN